MPDGRDAGRQPAEPRDQPAEGRPIRPVDDHRWQASWDRFQAAHDDSDAADDPPITANANGQPLGPAAVAAEPVAAPVVAANRAPRHQRQKASRAVPPAVRPPVPPAVPAGEAQPAPSESDVRLPSAEELSSRTLLRPRADRPAKGWRRVLLKASGGSVNPGLSAAEQRERDVMRRIVTPVEGCHRIAVISLKGGVGKTTTTACLGLTLAQHRGDRVVALDANPDSGTLAERLTGGERGRSVSDLLADVGDVRSFTDIASYTSLAERLQVLGSQQQPEMSEAFDENSYRAVDEVLARFFNIVLVDSGTGLLHSAMTGTLRLANSLVVVAGPTVDGAGRAAKTLDWLVVHGYGELVARSVAVISSLRPDTGDVNVALLRNHFTARCRRVVEIPYDPHLATGGRIDRAEWQRPTAEAFLAAAVAVAEGFAHPAGDTR